MTRRTLCKLFVIGFMAGLMDEFGDDDDDGG